MNRDGGGNEIIALCAFTVTLMSLAGWGDAWRPVWADLLLFFLNHKFPLLST